MTRYAAWTILTGAACVMGGTLRIVAIFTVDAFDAGTLAFFYYLIDVLLMLGFAGWYVSRAERLGGAGLAGFVIGVCAILLIRSRDLLGTSTYQIGAALLALGLAILSAAAVFHRDRPMLAPMLWLGSAGLGIVTYAFKPVSFAIGTISGPAAFALFGAGFIAAGAELLRIRERS